MLSIINDESALEIGLKMSLAHQGIQEALVGRSDPEKKWAVIPSMNNAINELNLFARSQENLFQRLIRVVLHLFGIITDYQKVLNTISDLEKEAKSIADPEIRLEKLRLEVLKTEHQIKIQNALIPLKHAFDAIESDIERISAKKLTPKDLSKSVASCRAYLERAYEPLVALTELYQEGVEGFKEIPILWDRYLSFSDTLDKIQESTSAKKPISTLACLPGGIQQGGNTCYLAAAMQTIHRIPDYKKLFDSSENPLQKRTGESDASYGKRLQIQAFGFDILEKISRGAAVSGNEIHTLRCACYEHFEDGKRIIANCWGPLDSVEVLERLLSVLDYKMQTLGIIKQDDVSNSTYEEIDQNAQTYNASLVSSIEAVQNYSLNENPTLSPFKYLNQEVSIMTLLQEFWRTEVLDTCVYKYTAEDGSTGFRRYSNVHRKKMLNIHPVEFPRVLKITIQQQDGARARITDCDTIYPSGTQGSGPAYKLAAIIEHQPGHYVAHLATPQGLITANDGWVHRAANVRIPGYAYFYILQDES